MVSLQNAPQRAAKSIFLIDDAIRSFETRVEERTLNANYSDNADIPLLSWFEKHPLINIIDHSLVKAGNLYLKDILILRFELKEEYARSFILLRSLLTFIKPAEAILSSNLLNKTVELRSALHKADNLIDSLSRIFDQLRWEIQFKAVASASY